MIKAILFDIDGMVNKRVEYFSRKYSREFGVAYDEMGPFFENEFILCEIGKADLKTELPKYLAKWKWDKSVDEFLEYWFKNETDLDKEMLNSIQNLRNKGTKCFLQTRNEKYRTEYLWNTMGLKNHFDGMFSSAYLGSMKPQVGFWNAIYQQLLEFKKDEILVWDDKAENVESAKKFGFQAKLFTGEEVI